MTKNEKFNLLLTSIVACFFATSSYAYKHCETVQDSGYYDCWCDGKVVGSIHANSSQGKIDEFSEKCAAGLVTR